MSTVQLPPGSIEQRPPEVVADPPPPAVGSRMAVRMTRFAPPQRVTQAIIICQVLPALRGEGDVDYLCGFCGAVIVEAVGHGQLQQLAFKCPTCVRYSEPLGEGDPVVDGTARSTDRLVFGAGVFKTTATITVPRTPFVLFGEHSE
jgi:hypothetical protein